MTIEGLDDNLGIEELNFRFGILDWWHRAEQTPRVALSDYKIDRSTQKLTTGRIP